MGRTRGKRILLVVALLLAALICLPTRVLADGAVSRGAWLGHLVDTFDITVEEEDYPDNYYTDVDSTSPYYLSVMRAVNFGIVDLEGGQDFRPDDPLTREFAAKTLNYCLGYQLEEDVTYTYSDWADVEEDARDSAQVAVDRGWFQLVGGKFDPTAAVTQAEVDAMLADADEVWHSTDSVGGEDNIVIKRGIKVVPEGTDVSFSDDWATLTITDCPVTLASGELFVVYVGDVPVGLRAASVSASGSTTTVAVEAVAEEDVFDAYEYNREGTIDLSGAEDVSGTEEAGDFLVAQAGGKTLSFS